MIQRNQLVAGLVAELFNELAAMKRQMQGTGQRLLSRFKLTRPQMEIFYLLQLEPGLTVSEVAERMGVSGGAVTQMVDILAKRGMIGRRPDPQDRRVSRLALSPEGRQLAEEMRAVHLAHMAEILDGFPEADLQALISGLHQLHTRIRTNQESHSSQLTQETPNAAS